LKLLNKNGVVKVVVWLLSFVVVAPVIYAL
jgi:hypothetical protein